MQRVGVELAVHKGGEEDDGVPLPRLDLDVDPPERRAAAVVDVVEVHEDGGDALPSARDERLPRWRVRVDAVVVLDVPLRVRVARHLDGATVRARRDDCTYNLEYDIVDGNIDYEEGVHADRVWP